VGSVRVPDVVSLDRSVISWLLAASGALLLFLIGLGVKDTKDKLSKIDRMCLEIERLKAKYDKDVAELHGVIGRLEQRIEDLHTLRFH
jgi:hypothetical protein